MNSSVKLQHCENVLGTCVKNAVKCGCFQNRFYLSINVYQIDLNRIILYNFNIKMQRKYIHLVVINNIKWIKRYIMLVFPKLGFVKDLQEV